MLKFCRESSNLGIGAPGPSNAHANIQDDTTSLYRDPTPAIRRSLASADPIQNDALILDDDSDDDQHSGSEYAEEELYSKPNRNTSQLET